MKEVLLNPFAKDGSFRVLLADLVLVHSDRSTPFQYDYHSEYFAEMLL